MTKFSPVWTKMELENRLEKLNEFLKDKKASFALSEEDIEKANFVFEEKDKENGFYVDVRTYSQAGIMLDEYKLGRVIGNFYHKTLNPELFCGLEDPRHTKLVHSVEHMFAMMLLIANESDARIDTDILTEYKSAIDYTGSYSILDEKTHQIRRAQTEKRIKEKIDAFEDKPKYGRKPEKDQPVRLPKQEESPLGKELRESDYERLESKKAPETPKYQHQPKKKEDLEGKLENPLIKKEDDDLIKPVRDTKKDLPLDKYDRNENLSEDFKKDKNEGLKNKGGGYDIPSAEELLRGHYEPEKPHIPKTPDFTQNPNFRAEPSGPFNFDIDGLDDYKKIESGFTDNPWETRRQKRQHDSFYAGLAVITGRGDGSENYIKVISNLLVSSKDSALFALYQILEY